MVLLHGKDGIITRQSARKCDNLLLQAVSCQPKNLGGQIFGGGQNVWF